MKAIMTETVQSTNGAVLKGEQVTIETSENGDYRISDSAGKIHYVPKHSLKIL